MLFFHKKNIAHVKNNSFHVSSFYDEYLIPKIIAYIFGKVKRIF